MGNYGRQLPDSWMEATIGEIAELAGGGTPRRSQAEFFGGGIVWLTPTEIPKTGVSVVRTSVETLTELGLRSSSARLVPEGTVLLTSRASIGYVAIAGSELSTNQGFALLLPRPGIYNYYLAYWLKSSVDLLKQNATGTTFKEISKSRLRPLRMPIPPEQEQRRIVDEIETQFDRLDTAVADLSRVQHNLDRYRASVLKAAFEGRLVPQDPADEPAEQLLERILAERRRRWEEQEWQKHVERAQKKVAQARRKTAGRPARLGDLEPEEWQDVPEEEYQAYLPKGERWREKYGQPERPEVKDLPELPRNWVWTSFDDLLLELRNGYFGGAPQQEPPGIRILRISAVRPMSVDLLDRKYLKEEFSPKVESYILEAGDLLFTRYNGNLHFVGVCGLVPELTEPTIYPDKLIRARVPKDLVLPEYLELYFASAVPRRYIEFKGKSTAGQQGISGGELKRTPVALPPLRVQQEIVEEVERCFSVVDGLEKAFEVNLARGNRLRQSILEKAFTGRLVPQDPDDEPAEKLLERIRKGMQAEAEQLSLL